MTTHFPLVELHAALLADGIDCTVLPGAQGRSARMFTEGFYAGCQASCVHHTASTGQYPVNDVAFILAGKGEGYVIANSYTALDGHVTLIASGPTYTEGKGGPIGVVPQDRGNHVSFSNEIAGGLGAPFPQAQCHAAMVLHYHTNRIAAEVWAWPDNPFGPTRLFSHFEYAPGRKIDPSGTSNGFDWATGYTMWDMIQFRADVSALEPAITPPEEAPMSQAHFAKVDQADTAALIIDATSARWLQTSADIDAAATVCTNTINDPIILLPIDCAARVFIGRLPHYKKGAVAGPVRCTADLWAQTV